MFFEGPFIFIYFPLFLVTKTYFLLLRVSAFMFRFMIHLVLKFICIIKQGPFPCNRYPSTMSRSLIFLLNNTGITVESQSKKSKVYFWTLKFFQDILELGSKAQNKSYDSAFSFFSDTDDFYFISPGQDFEYNSKQNDESEQLRQHSF